MFRYFLKRLLFAGLALFILLVLVFFLMQAVPGYPIVRENNDTDASYLIKVEQAGLLDNVFVQFWRLLSGLFTGSGFGIVYSSNSKVLDTMLQPIKYSMMIAGPSFILSAFIGILLGVVSAYYRGKWPDYTINALAVLFVSVPSFVLALYLIQVAGLIGLPTNFIAPGTPGSTTGEFISSIIIPILSMTLASISVIIYYTRNELVEVLKQEYIKTALAKGYKFRTVVFKYGFRNAFIPIISILAPSFVTILSGSIIIEKFFNVPGTATTIVDSITKKEFNIVVFAAVFYSAIYFLIQIFTDLSYPIIDPRIVLAQSSSMSLTKKAKAFLHRNFRTLIFDETSLLNKNYVSLNKIKKNIKKQLSKKVSNECSNLGLEVLSFIYQNKNVSLQDINTFVGQDISNKIQIFIANNIIEFNESTNSYRLSNDFDYLVSTNNKLIKDGVLWFNENVSSVFNLRSTIASRLRYKYYVNKMVDNSVQELDTFSSNTMFIDVEQEELESDVKNTTSSVQIQNENIPVESKMFEQVNIFSMNDEQISGKPTTYLTDLFKRFFKSKISTVFTSILGFIILFSIITSLVNLKTFENPISLDIPSSIIAYLPPRIPWLGISGVSTVIIDADTYHAIASLGINGIWKDVVQIGDQYQLVDFNPYKIPGLENITVMLGTDGLGRNWWNLLWYSTLQSLVLAVIVAIVSVVIGTIYGSIAGSRAGTMVDVIMMRIVEILSGVPTILWVLIFGLVFSNGNLSLPVVGLALILVSWMWPSIIARTYIIKYKDAEFVQAAKTLGASETRILFSHLLPNIAGRLVVIMVNTIPRVIFFEASLVFLGVRSVNETSLGGMIETARLNPYPWLLLGPTIMIVLITLLAQLVSNNLNDSLDPKVSGD